MKKEETNDIVQYLIPQLNKLGILKEYIKVDVTTDKSGKKRGDIWISTKKQNDNNFDKNIIALIEAKHRNTNIGDMDWRDAMAQGKEKAQRQNLCYYIVTNCSTEIRYYNGHNDEEIMLDGSVLVKNVPIEVLIKIQTQVSPDNSYVIHRASKKTRPISENKFRATLKNLADIYRSAGLKKGDDRIDPTISFVVLKYISEKELVSRSLDPVIKLWDSFKKIAFQKETIDLKVEFDKMVDLIWGKKSSYRDNIYKDFANLINFPNKLNKEHFDKIFKELDQYHFYRANFDLFGAIYEEFASQTKKKEFGEFYTRRHITALAAKLLLRNEINPRDFRICDPACGTGGFLTEAYKALITNYSLHGRLNNQVNKILQEKTFWGFDNDEKSVARTKLNMFLVGDGHINIHENDSLIGWKKEIQWDIEQFDYILTNPPMGKYDGEANIEFFAYTNERRYELLFIEKAIDALKFGGEIAIIVNDGALEAPSRENFRKKLFDNCNIFSIISLTKFAFAPYTKEKTYIMFMQKKQQEERGNLQNFPIWHYILDYDGFANSDKRFRTIYHNDLPELHDKFDGAISLAQKYIDNKSEFYKKRKYFERSTNESEKEEGLWGRKYGYVEISEINEHNFYNLLSEFYLRPITCKEITPKEFDEILEGIFEEYRKFDKMLNK